VNVPGCDEIHALAFTVGFDQFENLVLFLRGGSVAAFGEQVELLSGKPFCQLHGIFNGFEG